MNRAEIERTLVDISTFLQGPAQILIKPNQRVELQRKTQVLLEKVQQPSELLYVGILGGTGVGKSTLINALARQEISTPSDRRPFTDKAVVYRHADVNRDLQQVNKLIRDPDAIHESSVIKDLVLLDLPDFDSVEPGNRRTVIEILPFLDCVVWVVSPEKYADEVFYDLVRETVMNPDHFTFVLNKADELGVVEGRTETRGNKDPHTRYKDVFGDFTFRLKHDAGLDQPRIFCVSALHATQDASPDSILKKEFDRFRDYLMKRRDAKEIASVKTLNVIEESRSLLAEIHSAVRPEDKTQLIRRIRAIEDKPSKEAIEGAVISGEQESRLAKLVYRVLITEDKSIGPVRLCIRLMDLAGWSRGNPTMRELTDEFENAAKTFSREARHDLEKLGNQMDSEIILELGQTEASFSHRDYLVNLEDVIDRAAQSFVESVEAARQSGAGILSAMRRWWQTMVLLVPWVVLAMKLIGLNRIEAFIDLPSLGSALKIGVAFITALFDPDGLSGILVALIFDGLLIWFLTSRRLRKLKKRAHRLATSGMELLRNSLDIALEQSREARINTAQKIEDGVMVLADLEQSIR